MLKGEIEKPEEHDFQSQKPLLDGNSELLRSRVTPASAGDTEPARLQLSPSKERLYESTTQIKTDCVGLSCISDASTFKHI